jgi:broad specificity phosphatase PhoE
MMAQELGEELVQKWRTSFVSRPPPMALGHKHWHGEESKYSDLLDKDQIPVTESLQDTMERTLPLWNDNIVPQLKTGKNVLVVAHGNRYVDDCYLLQLVTQLRPHLSQLYTLPVCVASSNILTACRQNRYSNSKSQTAFRSFISLKSRAKWVFCL